MKKNISLISAIVGPILAFIAMAIMAETKDSGSTRSDGDESTFDGGGSSQKTKELSTPFGEYAQAYAAIKEMNPIGADDDSDDISGIERRKRNRDRDADMDGAEVNVDAFDDYVEMDDDTDYSDHTSGDLRAGWELPEIGTYRAIIDGKNNVMVEVRENSKGRFSGVVYYPSVVDKHGMNENTLMPFSGMQAWDDDGIDMMIKMQVKSNSDKSYSEEWRLFAQDGVSGTIKTSTGKEWTVVFFDE